MSSADSLSSEPRRSRWRFTLAGLFVLVLGVAVGLGWWRMRPNEIGEAILAAAAVWFAIGMLQQCVVAWRRSRETGVTCDVRFGQWVVCAISATLPLMLLLAAAAKIGHYHNRWSPDRAELVAASAFLKLVDAVFFVALLGGYLMARVPVVQARRESTWPHAVASWRAFVSACGAVAGATLLLLLLVNAFAITWLVHIAIRGVHHALPLSWEGVRITEASPLHHADANFLTGGTVAAGLLLVAVLLTWLMAKTWKRPWRVAAASGAAAVLCLIAVAWLVGWCHRVGFPAISPHLAANMITPSPICLALAGALVVAAATALALKWTAQCDESADQLTGSQRAPRLLHDRALVMAVLLLVTAWELSDECGLWDLLVELWQSSLANWSHTFEFFQFSYVLMQPESLLRLAIVVLLSTRCWTRWRTAAEPAPRALQLNPARFSVTWLLCLALVLLAGPVAAWSGFAILMSMGMS